MSTTTTAPRQPGGPGGGTHPEQLFAAGWSACFQSATAMVARQMTVRLPPASAIDTEVDLRRGGDGYSLSSRILVRVPGIDRDVAQAIIDGAHQTRPYSKAIRGHVDVSITLA